MSAEYFAMRVLEMAPQVFVTGQIFEQDLKVAAKQGVKTVVNNRPDDEALGQPRSADLERAAGELGMRYVYFPVVSGAVTAKEIEEYATLVRDLERPMLIFCRSGARSMQLWQMAERLIDED